LPSLCSIFDDFSPVFLTKGQVTHVLLTRPPLPALASRTFDLHVLGTPPAFLLSQDQTRHSLLSGHPYERMHLHVERSQPNVALGCFAYLLELTETASANRFCFPLFSCQSAARNKCYLAHLQGGRRAPPLHSYRAGTGSVFINSQWSVASGERDGISPGDCTDDTHKNKGDDLFYST
jgi:hypothetical protein